MRSKSGCLSCRRKKKKCDEAQPICTLCSRTSSRCEWPISEGKFLHKNNKGILDFQKTKRVKVSEDIYKKRNDMKSISPRTRKTVDNSVNASYPRDIHDLETLEGDSRLPYALDGVTPEFLKDQGELDTCGLGRPLFSDGGGSTQGESDKESPVYQELYDTFRDFMFLNAASRNPQTSVQMPLGLDDVDANDYFKSFLNCTNKVLPTQLHEKLPQPVSGTNILSLSSDILHSSDSTVNDNSPNSSFKPARSSSTQGQAIIESPNYVVDEIRLNHRDFELFTNFVEEIAGWLDMFDHKKHFTTIFVTQSKKCLPLYYSILAISSRHLDRTKNLKNERLTYRLYQRSLYYLVPMVKSNSNIEVVASCIILCVFEMMNPSPLDWRKHLKGGATLLMAANINGFSDSIEKSLFWCFLRMDICNALINDEPTLIPLRNWGESHAFEGENVDDLIIAIKYKEMFLSLSSQNSDMYSNYVVFLAARTVNLIFDDSHLYEGSQSVSFEDAYDSLFRELLEWYTNRPVTLKPIICDSDNEEFPKLLFSNSPGISGNQMYHMIMILMNTNKPRGSKVHKAGGICTSYKNHLSSAWHAKRIVGISLVNKNDHGCLSNALQPVYFAGKVLTSKKEHQVILNLLRDIEMITGLSCEWRINDLEAAWNAYS